MEPRFLPYSGTAVFDFVQTGRCRAHSSHTPRYPLCTRGSARFFHELRAWPAEFDLSQSRAAQIFDVSMRTIQEWEQERAAPAQDALHGDMGPNGAHGRARSVPQGGGLAPGRLRRRHARARYPPSRFNDDGVTALYQEIAERVAEFGLSSGKRWLPRVTVKQSSAGRAIVPLDRSLWGSKRRSLPRACRPCSPSRCLAVDSGGPGPGPEIDCGQRRGCG